MRAARLLVATTLLCALAAPVFAQYPYLVDAFPNLSFSFPVDFQNAGDGTRRVFVVEKIGRIQVVAGGQFATEKKEFLDISTQVDPQSEGGLLGLAFHPDYANNGYFFVNYTAKNPFRTVVSRFSVDPDNPNAAVDTSEVILLEFSQPAGNHNAGQLAFGPNDGYLYIASGDGGPSFNAQNTNNFLGNVLRIDVDTPSPPQNYSIPPDNPFATGTNGQQTGLPEIYAWGFRNPYRMSFDPPTGDLWLGDVGLSAWEEINLVENGRNYGWDTLEGYDCSFACDTTGMNVKLPMWLYDHSQGIAIIGGYVYRGSAVPFLSGRYVYADYVSGRIWALQKSTSGVVVFQFMNNAPVVTSFGVDEDGELYLCSNNGKVYRFEEVPTAVAPTAPQQARLDGNMPNPFNPTTSIRYTLAAAGDVEINIFDVLGKRVRSLNQRAQGAGTHQVRWDGTSDTGEAVSSGVYFYNLVVDGRIVDNAKMNLLK